MTFPRVPLALLFAVSAHAAALLDETFENHAAAHAPGAPWTVGQIVAPSSVTVEEAARSALDGGRRGLVWTDGDTTSWGPVLSLPFPAQTGDAVLLWTFDYLAPDDGMPANANFNLASTKGTASGAGPNLFLDRIPGELQANDGASVVKIGHVAPDTWHRVEVTVYLATGTYDVAVRGPRGGAIAGKTGLKFRNPATSTLSFLNLGDGAQTSAGGSVHLDNIRLKTRTP